MQEAAAASRRCGQAEDGRHEGQENPRVQARVLVPPRARHKTRSEFAYGMPCKAILIEDGSGLQLPAILWRRGVGLRTMAYEIEIKLAIRNSKALLKALKRLGAKPANPKAPRMHEMNLIFDTPDGGLAKHGQLLRIRTETPAPGKKGDRGRLAARTVLTFKSPPEELAIGDVGPGGDRRHKVREEIETELTNGATLQRIFEGLGLRGWFR